MAVKKNFAEDNLVNISNKEEYFKLISESIRNNKKKTFYYLNSQSFYLYNKDANFKKALDEANYIIADGYSITFRMKKLTGQEIEKVVFTYSFFGFLADFFVKYKTRLFFLGADKTTIKTAINNFEAKYREINICGFSDGYFDVNSETEQIITKINSASPDIIICGMGMPRSEIWLNKNREKLNVKCIFSVGGFFDFAAGNVKIAPDWMYNTGIEWIYRFIQEPGRLFKRYAVVNSYFILRFIKDYIRIKSFSIFHH